MDLSMLAMAVTASVLGAWIGIRIVDDVNLARARMRKSVRD